MPTRPRQTRRRRSSGEPSARAHDAPGDVTERLARMEAALAKLQDAVAASASRLTSLQAQIDHLVAKIRPV